MWPSNVAIGSAAWVAKHKPDTGGHRNWCQTYQSMGRSDCNAQPDAEGIETAW
jgi:hypothetical protein